MCGGDSAETTASTVTVTKATMRCVERGPADASDAGLRGLMSAALRPQSRRIPEDYSRLTAPAGKRPIVSARLLIPPG
ncbi:hypothetical protein GCM10010109_20090 [Actinoplanes campanulatus]|nr:hypothetical protein GCM10010109_20090 [Actinoplanes campanulatus]